MTTTTPIQLYGNFETWKQQQDANTANYIKQKTDLEAKYGITSMEQLDKMYATGTLPEGYEDDFNKLIEDYLNKQDEIGYYFGFMEGKEVKEDGKDYNAQLTKLSQGEKEVKDTDKNGTVSFDEYLDYELADYGEVDKATKDMISAMTQKLFSVIDCLETDGELTVDEFKIFYTFLDQVQLDENFMPYVPNTESGKFNFDGAFNYDEITEAINALTT